jgi:protein NirF
MDYPDKPIITKAGVSSYCRQGISSECRLTAGLFGEDALVLLDLWRPEAGGRRILEGYRKGEEQLPVYKMPHLEGWAQAGELLFFPAVGRHELLVVDARDWREVGRIPVHGQPVFAVARPDGRQVWVAGGDARAG